jgi:hypothetical protein
MKICGNCKHWQIIPATNSAQGDRQMEALNYRNCLKDETSLKHARFLNINAQFCSKFERKKYD